MQELYKLGTNQVKTTDPVDWPELSSERFTDPESYLPSKELTAAVNVALNLGRPLLLTGEPGTGKSRLAASVAHQLSRYSALRIRKIPLQFNVRSNSVARELFYSFDSMRKFSDYSIARTIAERKPNANYLTLSVLGIAFLLTQPKHPLYNRLPIEYRPDTPIPQRSVVLIDEVDKAPRDFPNDLLNQIDTYEFSIPELAEGDGVQGPSAAPVVSAAKEHRPFVIITSNSEKHLPDAFLRRCIFFHIEFPNRENLSKIVECRFASEVMPSRKLLEATLELFFELRDRQPSPQKKPGTAEYLDWLDILAALEATSISDFDIRAPATRNIVESSLSVLAKTRDDAARAKRLLKEFSDPAVG